MKKNYKNTKTRKLKLNYEQLKLLENALIMYLGSNRHILKEFKKEGLENSLLYNTQANKLNNINFILKQVSKLKIKHENYAKLISGIFFIE